MIHRGKWKFGELFEHLLDTKVITFGEILVYGTDEKGVYEKIHHCGLGTFTGIGYHYLLANAIVDSFTIDYGQGNRNICIFYLSCEEDKK